MVFQIIFPMDFHLLNRQQITDHLALEDTEVVKSSNVNFFVDIF